MSAAQMLRQAEALKTAAGVDVSKESSDAWVSRQKLQDTYQRLLIMDLEYALDKKVEQDLWNHAFKNQITSFQNQAKDKSNPRRNEVQGTLGLFLDMASGFYLQLFQELCSAFKLDLPMRKGSNAYGILKDIHTGYTRLKSPKKSSSLYICQYCLVHLGDIARYRQQVEQAQTYYRHAASVVPYNGQPYNQLAILEAAKGNKLSTVFYYIRSIAVKHPFPVASTNLEKFYAKISKDNNEYKNKLSMNEIISGFLQFHALLHHCADLDKAKSLLERICQGFNTHIPSSFSAYQLLQMTSINLFALFHAKRKLDLGGAKEEDEQEVKANAKETEINGEMKVECVPSTEDLDELSSDEKICYDMIFDLLLHMLDVILQSSPKHESKLKDHHTLPSLKIILDWVCSDVKTLQHPHFSKYNGIWSNLAKNLNNLQFTQDQTQQNGKRYVKVPLPEDRDLHCFLPLSEAHSSLNFTNLSLEGVPENYESHLRHQRLTEHGVWLAEKYPSLNLLNVHRYKSGRLEFSSTTPQIKLVAVESDSQTEPRATRQNVAIQAIMQNRAKLSGSVSNQTVTTQQSTASVATSNSSSSSTVTTALQQRDGSGVEKSKSEPVIDQTASSPRTKTAQSSVSASAVPPSILRPSSGTLSERKTKIAAIWSGDASQGEKDAHFKVTAQPDSVRANSVYTQPQQSSANTKVSSDSWLSSDHSPVYSSSNISRNQSAEPTMYFVDETKTSGKTEKSATSGPYNQSDPNSSNPFGLTAFGPLQLFNSSNQQQQNQFESINRTAAAADFLQQQQYNNNNADGVSQQSQVNLIKRPPPFASSSSNTTSVANNMGNMMHQAQQDGYNNNNKSNYMGGYNVSSDRNLPAQPGFPGDLLGTSGLRMRANSIPQGLGVSSGVANMGIRPQRPWGVVNARQPVRGVPPPGVTVGASLTGVPVVRDPWNKLQQQPARPQWGLPPNTSTNSPPKPIGPSANQLPIPTFDNSSINTMATNTSPNHMRSQQQMGQDQGLSLGGLGSSSSGVVTSGHTRQQFPPPWETAGSQLGGAQTAQSITNGNSAANNIHPTLQQLFQSAKGPMSSGAVGNSSQLGDSADHPGLSGGFGSMNLNVGGGPPHLPDTSNPLLNFTGNRDLSKSEGNPGKIAGSPAVGSMMFASPQDMYGSQSSGTYSLFNSQSPWSLPINKGDAQSLSSSPFGSSTASNRTTPDHYSSEDRSPNINIGGFGAVSSTEGQWPVNPTAAAVGNNSHNPPPAQNIISNNMQTMWSGGPSALERLLEAQRQQKTDPH